MERRRWSGPRWAGRQLRHRVQAQLAAAALVGTAVLAACGPPPPPPPPPWAASTRVTPAGHLATDIGCAASREAGALEAFFSRRVGPVLGWDYQHVYPLGANRWLWLFQDAFIDHAGQATRLDGSGFAHNAALVQTGTCFTLLHRGSASRPSSFEPGEGETPLHRWWWPLGGELEGTRLRVFWAEMVRDEGQPPPGDGLPWHPRRTWLATYDAATLARLAFVPAPGQPSAVDRPAGPEPLYGYAVASDETHTYLFGNTYQQNLTREGGFWEGPHSASAMWLGRVPRGRLDQAPEYWNGTRWVSDRDRAEPVLERYWTENPMQPRYLDGRWVAVTKANGFWGDRLAVDVAAEPWGPWLTGYDAVVTGRGADPRLNTYHAHPLPWASGSGTLVVGLSQNARDMHADAFPFPERYRPIVMSVPFPTLEQAAATATAEQVGAAARAIPEPRQNDRWP